MRLMIVDNKLTFNNIKFILDEIIPMVCQKIELTKSRLMFLRTKTISNFINLNLLYR